MSTAKGEIEPAKVWIWGRGGDGQLGFRDSGDVSLPLALDGIADPTAFSVVCGGKHTLILTESGTVQAWGWNWRGQCGTGDFKDILTPTIIKAFTLMKALQKTQIVKISAGDEHSIALSSDGRLYSYGSNADGQLGHADVKGFYLQPRLILPLHRHRIVDVSCGGGHTLAVTDQGEVYTFGRGSKGRLGCGSQENQPTPTLIASLHGMKVVSVACGWSHSLVLAADGRVFAFGSGSDGQLGLGRRGDVSVPFLVNFFVENNIAVDKIAAGYYQSAAMVGGKLYTWGWGDKGQLGHGELKSELNPRLVSALAEKNTTAISFGGFHTLIVSDGQCYSCGIGQHHQLGTGVTDIVSVPTLIPTLEDQYCISVRSGLWHSVAITSAKAKLQQAMKEQAGSNATSSSSSIETSSASNNVVDADEVDTEIAELKEKLGGGESVEEELTESDFANIVVPATPAAASSSTSTALSTAGSSSNNGKDSNSPQQSPRQGKRPLSGSGEKPSLLSRIQRLFSYSVLGDAADNRVALTPEEMELQKKREANDALTAVWNTKILPKFDEMFNKPETKRLWQKGIPSSLRNIVWNKVIRNKLKITEDEYERLKQAAKDQIMRERAGGNADRSKEGKSGQSYFDVIEVDVPRTFPETKLFSANGPLHAPLTEILQCYSIYSSVGYVQGMSFLGAMLLFYIEDSFTAFKCLANILNTHFFRSLFMMDIPQILRHVRVYSILFESHMPKLYAKFKEFGISAEHYLLDWFMTIFGKSLPLEVSSRVWDNFLLDGEVFLYRTGLAILKKNESTLLKASFEECILLLHEVSKGVSDFEELFNIVKTISVPSYIHAYIRKMEAENERTILVTDPTSVLSAASASSTVSSAAISSSVAEGQ